MIKKCFYLQSTFHLEHELSRSKPTEYFAKATGKLEADFVEADVDKSTKPKPTQVSMSV